MTAWKAYSLSCDHADCEANFEGEVDFGLGVVRQDARNEGWVFRKGKDYCPKHAEVGS